MAVSLSPCCLIAGLLGSDGSFARGVLSETLLDLKRRAAETTDLLDRIQLEVVLQGSDPGSKNMETSTLLVSEEHLDNLIELYTNNVRVNARNELDPDGEILDPNKWNVGLSKVTADGERSFWLIRRFFGEKGHANRGKLLRMELKRVQEYEFKLEVQGRTVVAHDEPRTTMRRVLHPRTGSSADTMKGYWSGKDQDRDPPAARTARYREHHHKSDEHCAADLEDWKETYYTGNPDDWRLVGMSAEQTQCEVYRAIGKNEYQRLSGLDRDRAGREKLVKDHSLKVSKRRTCDTFGEWRSLFVFLWALCFEGILDLRPSRKDAPPRGKPKATSLALATSYSPYF